MTLLAHLLPFLTPSLPAGGPVPQLLPGWPARRQRRRGVGTFVRRLGGPHVLGAARGSLPRLRGIEAVRGFCLWPVPVTRVEIVVDGRVVHVGDAHAATTTERAGLGKYVFNLWHDFSDIAPGRHTLVVRPVGLLGRLLTRSRRRLIVEPPAEAPASDAYVPRAPGDTRPIEAIVAALPTNARPARRGVLPDPVRSILVLRADQLGDLVVSLPALTRLRALFPAARITGVVTQANLDLARTLDLFDELIVVTFAGDGLAADEQERLQARFAEARCDVALDLGEGARSRLLLLLSGAPFRYGFRHGDHLWLSASYEFNARDAQNGMEVMPPSAKLMGLVESLGALRAADPLLLHAAAPSERLGTYGILPGERIIVLHTGARLVPSRWPGFGRLAALLLQRTRCKLLVFTHGDPAEKAQFAGHDPDRLRVIDHQLPFADFDALLGSCAVLVGNDSGPKHLAALRGAKVVSLHMARLNWSEWGQEGEGLILSRRVPCAGCNIGDQPDECGRDYVCLHAITPEEVCAAVESLL